MAGDLHAGLARADTEKTTAAFVQNFDIDFIAGGDQAGQSQDDRFIHGSRGDNDHGCRFFRHRCFWRHAQPPCRYDLALARGCFCGTGFLSVASGVGYV